MSIFSIILISVYIGLSLLPIIYNHIMTRGSVVKENDVKNVFNKPSKKNTPSFLGNSRSLIVFLNNLNEDQINYILNQLKNFGTIKDQFHKGKQD